MSVRIIYLLDDEARVHDIHGHRGIRGGAECRHVELGEAASCDRLQAELLHDRTTIGITTSIRAGHLRQAFHECRTCLKIMYRDM